MELWIQPCAPCADLYGQPSTVHPHDTLTLVGAGAVKDAQVEQHYTCTRCSAAFTRILKGEPRKQVWMLLNAGQH
ncbi:hypothetical protein CUJ88_36260 [Paraburkholderia hospita]|uniref:Uncharacterized protein n=1 Tax=Paraburkholderia hospita TaxID=169430 RepID=A0AAJ4X4F5_9BURK|nr:hypothetical protein C2L64_39320 [Paraburkholderia hospita]SKD01408.1 hypothetical protein SAMN05445504_8381 [Burkholderia sp. CF099]SOE84155.1 hypothetical protein SAMN05446935_4582 [Burkholderia sp. YR290]AXF03937.1 hypothetical protein CUJ88_36260 [Paraburkholderia hospita]OUL84590.1 hypothetical protein CA601_25710 [Paraburkholderia hospita]